MVEGEAYQIGRVDERVFGGRVWRGGVTWNPSLRGRAERGWVVALRYPSVFESKEGREDGKEGTRLILEFLF